MTEKQPIAQPEEERKRQPVQRIDTMPRSVPFIVGNEAAERFSFYGMRSILMLYMTSVLLIPDYEATRILHTFIAAVYFFPLIGGWLADRYFGRYWTILTISLLYCLGHAALAIFEGKLYGLYLGLALIAIGSGGIKPCVSAFVGDQFGPEREHLLPKVYGWFYWSINFGSFFSMLLIPYLKENYGYRVAFGVPGIAMGLATLIFWLGTPTYVRKPPSRETGQKGFWPIVLYAIKHLKERKRGESFLDVARKKYSEEEVQAAKAVLYILLIFAPAPLFWSLFDQTASTWILQGEKMVPLSIPLPFAPKFSLNAETIQSLNPLLVMLLIPLFTMVLYPWADRLGLRPTPLRRMTLGMFLAAFSYVIVGWYQIHVEHGARMSILWQVIPYIVLTSAEVLFSTTGLEFAFTQAPKSMKSIIMSFWLLTVCIGDSLISLITTLNEKVLKTSLSGQFFLYAGMVVIVAILFGELAIIYRRLRAKAGLPVD